MMLKWLLYLVFFFSTNISFAQKNCNIDKLYGLWIRADRYIYPRDTLTKENLDKLLNDSIKDKGWGWIFDNEKRTSFPGTETKIFRVDEKGCKIIYGASKNPSRLQITSIIYLDEKYLVLQIPNRHSYTTSCFRKK